MAFSVGKYPSADTLMVWLPGLTGLFTPSDAMGTGVLSMTTSGLVGPSTVIVTHGSLCGSAPYLFGRIFERLRPRMRRARGDTVADDPVVALLRFDQSPQSDLRAREPQKQRGRVHERVGAAELVDGDCVVLALQRLLPFLRERARRGPVGGGRLGQCGTREESEREELASASRIVASVGRFLV